MVRKKAKPNRKKNPKFYNFLDSLRTEATRSAYEHWIPYVLGQNPDSFLKLPPSKKERFIEDYVKRYRNKDSSAYLRNKMGGVSSFLDYCKKNFDWNRIDRTMPVSNYVADDQAPSKEQVRRLLNVLISPYDAIVLIMISCGCRVGALEGLRLRHYWKITRNRITFGALRLYEGSREVYTAYISPEAVKALDRYLESRKILGENLTPESWLFRTKFGKYSKSRTVSVDTSNKPRMLCKNSIQAYIQRAWIKSGVRKRIPKAQKTRHRYDFQMDHGFRKYFTTYAPLKMKPETSERDVEILLNHKNNYPPPTEEHLQDQFIRAIPSLAITEEAEVKIELDETKRDLHSKIQMIEESTQKQIDSLKLSILQAQLQASQVSPRAIESPTRSEGTPTTMPSSSTPQPPPS